MAERTERPNLIYILADDMGYGDVSCMNPNSAIRTRHIDRLARQGMCFEDAHASSAVCTPSRYSILTGRYNWRSWLKHGVTWGYSRPVIESGRMTVAALLKTQGYATACTGKWHLGWNWARNGEGETDIDFSQPITEGPLEKGFDTFFGISASLDMPPYVYVHDDRVTMVPERSSAASEGKGFWREGPIAADFEHAGVLPRLLEKALDFIRQQAQADCPFFLYFPLPAPHTPILPLAAFQGKSGTNAYGDFCLQVDDLVGQVMNTLEQLDIAEDTILIFTSDNGCSPMADFGELAQYGHHPSHVFRGHKADIYEGGHRIPFIVRWPRRIPEGTRSAQTVCLSDLMRTMADIVGVSLPEDAAEDSVSSLPTWLGAELSRNYREATVHTSVDGSLSIRQGRWKLEMCPGSGGWSFPKPGPECEGLPAVQLYDLEADIGERVNLEAQHPEIVQDLQALLTDYVRRGRSTPGLAQENTGGDLWAQLWWMLGETAQHIQEDAQREAERLDKRPGKA